MNEQDVLGAFLLVNNPIVLSEEETKDVQKAIKQLQQENKILKENAENNDKVVDKVNWENMLLKKENAELKSQLRGTTHCFDEEEHNKLKEEITNLSKDVDMWNAKYNDMFDENRMLKKQVENYKKLGFKYLQDKNNNLETQQKEFINFLEDNYKETQDIWYIKILQKYKSIIGVSDENNMGK